MPILPITLQCLFTALLLCCPRAWCFYFYRHYSGDPWLRQSSAYFRRVRPWLCVLLFNLCSLPVFPLSATVPLLVCWQLAVLLGTMLIFFDLKFRVLPNVLLALLILPGLALAWFHDDFSLHVLCLALAGCVIMLVHRMSAAFGFFALGGGDLKFIAVSAAWLDLMSLLLMVTLACSMTLLGVWACSARTKSSFLKACVPFGPGLVSAFWLLVLLSGRIVI